MSILNRILILTLLYQIPYIALSVIVWIPPHEYIRPIIYDIMAIMMSYSVFLMQSHNTKQYQKFLNILYCTKLYYIGCCCFGNMIKNDLYSSNSMNSSVGNTKEIETKIPDTKRQSTIFETGSNTGLDVPNIAIKPTFSIESTIEEMTDGRTLRTV